MIKPTIRALCVAVALVGAALGQELTRWPAPPDGWWRSLDAGEQATYELRQGGLTGRRVMTVERIEGSRVTVSFEQAIGGAPPVRQMATIDLADPTDQGDLALPEGTKIVRVRAEEVAVGERTLPCDVYEVAIEGPKGPIRMTTWHSSKLPPVFMGGVVKLESSVGGAEASVALVDYKGRLLD